MGGLRVGPCGLGFRGLLGLGFGVSMVKVSEDRIGLTQCKISTNINYRLTQKWSYTGDYPTVQASPSSEALWDCSRLQCRSRNRWV